MTEKEYSTHIHKKGESWWEYDGKGIPLCKVCDMCVEYKLSKYRPAILRSYDESDVDEQIEDNY